MTVFAVVGRGEVDGILARHLPAARRHGVERKAPRSLGETLPHEDWSSLAATLGATGKLLEDG